MKYLLDTNVLVKLQAHNLMFKIIDNYDIYITKSCVKEFVENFVKSGDRDQEEVNLRKDIIEHLKSKVIDVYEFILKDKEIFNISNINYNLNKDSGINDVELFLFSKYEECNSNYIIVTDEPKILKSLSTKQSKLSYDEFVELYKKLHIANE